MLFRNAELLHVHMWGVGGELPAMCSSQAALGLEVVGLHVHKQALACHKPQLAKT